MPRGCPHTTHLTVFCSLAAFCTGSTRAQWNGLYFFLADNLSLLFVPILGLGICHAPVLIRHAICRLNTN